MVSCVKDLDFDQSKGFEFKPMYTATLMYFDLNQTAFVFQNTEVLEVSDTLAFSLLNNKTMQNQLEKVEILFKVENQFNRDFKIELDFLDNQDKVVQQIDPIEVPGNATNYEQRFTINIANSPEFLTSTKLKVSIQLKPSSDGSILDITDQKVLSFKSGADFYLKIQ
ncbi:hypothetical protein GCM10011416_02990 [Polaribacter pacificus]|uniref:Uncharacterized protein n=2 Tax=Polaribacter pacificus TaxID=1775173 RepID=A0A917HUQ4_9FLAO|nr:hypothetical protein GCM10011416_02990 [Polaribacter pacificus]